MKNCRNCGGAPRPNRDACIYCGTATEVVVERVVFFPARDEAYTVNDVNAAAAGRRWAEDMTRAFMLSTPTPGQRMFV